MTKILSELITDKTSVLDLTDNDEVSDTKKIEVLDLENTSQHVKKEYIKYMYYYNSCWYYFKKDKNNYEYPFYMIDELMGMFLSKKTELPTIEYEVSKINDTYGLASKNFKDNKHTYSTLHELIGYPLAGEKKINIDLLKLLCISDENEQKFLKHIFQMFAIDIIMLQRDRCVINLQFQIDKETNEFDLGPLYDFSNCSPKIMLNSKGVWNIKNIIIDLNKDNIMWLLNNYPEFKCQLEFYLELKLSNVWNEICKYYNLNQDTAVYERIKDYYEIKQESVNKNIRQLIKY